MGGLAHYLEGSGIPTTQISLVRPHTEKICPPRALWVSFDFGRPFGVPNDPGFQRRVLRRALILLEAGSGPVLESYDEDAPGSGSDASGWACPVDLRPRPQPLDDPTGHLTALLGEMRMLGKWYDLGREKRGRSTVGVSGLKPEQAARHIVSYLAGQPEENPRPGTPPATLLKLACEDLRAFYTEAAVSQPGSPTPQEVSEWFWGQTQAGWLFLALPAVLARIPDKATQMVGERMVVPYAQRHRLKDKGI